MRVLFLGNNTTGRRVLELLVSSGAEVVGVWVHDEAGSACRDEILTAAAEAGAEILSGPPDESSASRVRGLRPDIGVSVFFGHILPQSTIDAFPRGCINLHPSLLPWNRGANPNVWSIVERSPAGASLHYIDAGIDSGRIIAQREVRVEPFDTGESLYRKLEEACFELFAETWPKLEAGDAPARENPVRAGSYHRRADLARVDEIDLDACYRARDLIDILRARTFPPYRGAYFRADGRKVFLELKLTPAEAEIG